MVDKWNVRMELSCNDTSEGQLKYLERNQTVNLSITNPSLVSDMIYVAGHYKEWRRWQTDCMTGQVHAIVTFQAHNMGFDKKKNTINKI